MAWSHLIVVIAVSGAVVTASWAALVVLARRLPAGLLRDLASVLPACVTTARRLRGDPRVPRRAKVAVAVAALWVVSPIDLLPEFLPVIGPLDDVLVVALALRYAARQVPRPVIDAAWPAESRLLDRLLGPGGEPTVGRDGPAAHRDPGAAPPRPSVSRRPRRLPAGERPRGRPGAA